MRAALPRWLPLFVLAVPGASSATTVGPLSTLEASPGTATQRGPAIAWDGARYVVVWEDGRVAGAGGELYLARLASDGRLLDPSGLPVQSAAQPGDQGQAAIAFNPRGAAVFIASVGPQSGSPEIYLSRFLPGSGSFADPAGTPLTSTPVAAEGAPAIACTHASCLVAFQETTGGVTQVRGRRLSAAGTPLDPAALDLVLDNTGRTTELGPAVTATGASFFVAWEDDRLAGSGLLGADLYGRRVPEVGAVSPIAGSILVSADTRQSRPSLVPILADQLLALWEDQRGGVLTADDVFVGRFDLMFGALAGRSLIAERLDQQAPKLAGGNGRALAVWQDFRSGAFGATYAARLDANGASLDGSGFAVLSGAAHVIEHAVAKGPGADYLVLAVRSSPAPARILARIVRDEPPAGTLTASGDTRIPADGATVATISFGPARGSSGFTVVDGTLYDLTLTSANPVITAPDADPTRGGHQLAAQGGVLTLGLRSIRPEVVTVSVASIEGSSVGTADVELSNVAPIAENVRITPPDPSSSDDLVLSYTYRDLNGDPELSSVIQWTRNSGLEAQYTNLRSVPAAATRRGDLWQASVRAGDGASISGPIFSNQVRIRNSPPGALNVRIDPSSGVVAGTTLAGRYTYADEDGDPESGTVIRWLEHDTEEVSLRGQSSVPGARVLKGQRWRLAIEASDGTETGPAVLSATVTVANSVPVARAGANGEVVERRRYVLDGGGSTDLDAGDSLRFNWRQISGPAVTLESATTATAALTAPSVNGTTPLVFALSVSDGESTSPEDQVTVVVTTLPDGDADGLDDEEEAVAATDPTLGDTDRDGAQDGPEVHQGTNPLDPDSDDDGVRDGAEPDPFGDADGDTRINALDPDADDDGILDGTELGVTAAPEGTDLGAGQFVADAAPTTTTDAQDADSDDDGLPDGIEDSNHNGRVDLGESDPLDRTSTVGCSPERTCPAGLVCTGDACRAPAAPDAGQTCAPIAQRRTECCRGGCANGTPVAALCAGGATAEQCPVGATECPEASCSAPAPAPAPSDGCGCAAARPAPRAARGGLALWLVGLMMLRGARRRWRDRA
ncbi:MAG: hypothetical protein IT384_26580 [Deltaproteobacteria bacterium]|nr:hypothetical protein [Deltaproteobacteria bacterium]